MGIESLHGIHPCRSPQRTSQRFRDPGASTGGQVMFLVSKKITDECSDDALMKIFF